MTWFAWRYKWHRTFLLFPRIGVNGQPLRGAVMTRIHSRKRQYRAMTSAEELRYWASDFGM